MIENNVNKRVIIEAVVIKKDGTKIDLGTIADSNNRSDENGLHLNSDKHRA